MATAEHRKLQGWDEKAYTPYIYLYFKYGDELLLPTGGWPGMEMEPLSDAESQSDVKGKVYSFAVTKQMLVDAGVPKDKVDGIDLKSLDMKVKFHNNRGDGGDSASLNFEGFDKLFNFTDYNSYDKKGHLNKGQWVDFDPSKLETGAAGQAKNVILMIGDGMGDGQIEYASQYGGHTLTLQSDDFNHTHAKTNSTQDVTDSAAAATALATGVKTNNGTVGKDAGGTDVENLTEYAEDQNMKTGLVVTQPICRATPAGFSAHVNNRGEDDNIASQQAGSEIDVLFGGGQCYFNGLQSKMEKNGYTYVTDFDSIAGIEPGQKVIGAFAEQDMLVDLNGNYDHQASREDPSLAEMTTAALERLENDNGFFLMVEGSDIDMYGHWSETRDATDALANMSAQLLSFDNAVEVAKKYVDENPDTLLIVTADHETGGLEDGKWTSNGKHTASFVSVYTYGAGAEGLTQACLVDNTDIHDYIEESIANYGYR